MWGGKVIFVMAVIGVVLSLAFLVRSGIYLALLTTICALAFWLMPQARFWNARVLPFYYLCIYLLAGIGLWLVLKTIWLLVTGKWIDPPLWFSATVTGSVAVVSYLILAMLMHSLPFGSTLVSSEPGKAIPAGQPVYGWGCSTDNGAQATANDCLWTTASSNPVRGWSEWNFRGLELKGNINQVTGVSDLKDWKEYKGIVDEMARIGAENGCGRSFWEFDNGQNKYGSTMAMMLLPYWTHSCIGSEEGLYFEASSTTPFHFLIQSELSDKPSRPMRMDEHVGFEPGDPSPYSPVNVSQGVSHLQMLGIKYFLTYSKTVDELAAAEPRLTRIGGSGPWTVYQVADAPLVVGLANKPAVWTDVSDDIHDWVKPSIDWFNDPNRWSVMPATSGPSDWPRCPARTRRPPPGGHAGGQGLEPDGVPRRHVLRRRPDRHTGARPHVVLPELGGHRRHRAVPGRSQHDGGRPDQHPRGDDLRPIVRRVGRLDPDLLRHRVGAVARPQGAVARRGEPGVPRRSQ